MGARAASVPGLWRVSESGAAGRARTSHGASLAVNKKNNLASSKNIKVESLLSALLALARERNRTPVKKAMSVNL